MELFVSGLKQPLAWSSAPASIETDDAGSITVTAAAETDVFIDPDSGEATASAPRALAVAPAGDFQLAARIKVGFRSTFDAGVLLVWHDERHNAKLCFERSADGVPTVVSVVTRGVSDDANGWTIDGNEVWLRISRVGQAWAMHASTDGQIWSLARIFRLDSELPTQIGFLAQSPTGDGCTVRFEELAVTERSLADARDGS